MYLKKFQLLLFLKDGEYKWKQITTVYHKALTSDILLLRLLRCCSLLYGGLLDEPNSVELLVRWAGLFFMEISFSDMP